ncbi:hypothetical protein L198_05195 [Cryptococcus wingfieldii CBS 7118]|uniref:Uncharacterized protein n=1 Tax=Cryptococcus wingfieldii CBS 7118 TaxID=1295528 RepID=A0A1E3J0J4_9TREE|nr:hypothetical protein L198_05195 [Cryptococcus wingfieldii CBS 7118]ODN94338.1 hypothetical protein L198_05195 [Cryptococcus wingfieldii CBS 7118]
MPSSNLEDIQASSDKIKSQLAKDRTLPGQKRLLKWTKGRKLVDESLQAGDLLPSEKTLELAEWIEDDLSSTTAAVSASLKLLWSHSIMGQVLSATDTVDCSKTKPQACLLVAEDARGPLGLLKRTERLLTGLTSFILTEDLLDARGQPAELANVTQLLCSVLELVAEGRFAGPLLHLYIGELLLQLSDNDECRQLLTDQKTLGFTKLGQLLFTSQSSTLSSSLLRLIHRLLPEHIKGSGKASARTKCCKDVIVKQGWSIEVAKEGLVAIGRMEKDLVPRHLAKLINIFSKESSLVRPVAFTLTSMSIDGDDQAAEDDASQAFDKGNMLLYIDSWGWRFELGGKLGSDVCSSHSHQDVRSVNISTNDKGSATHELIATSLLGDTTTIKFTSPSAALNPHLDLGAPRRISTPDPAETPSAAVEDLVKPYPKSEKIIAPAKKVEEMKRKQRFSSMGGARGGTTITSDAEDVFSSVEDDPKPKRNSVTPAACFSGGEKDAHDVRVKVEEQVEPKKEKVPVPFKSEEQEDSESEDELFVNRRFISSTPKNAIAKTYGSKPSSRRPMLVKSPILDDPSPKSFAITATPHKRAPKATKSTKKSSTLPTLTPGGKKESQQTKRLKTKSSTLAGEIKIGREATPGSLRDESVESHTDKPVGRTQKKSKAKSTVVSEKSKKAASSSVDTEHDDGDSSSEDEKSPSIPTARPETLQSAGTDEVSPSAVKAGMVKGKNAKTKVAAPEESESEAEAPLAKTRRSKSSVKLQTADPPASESEAAAPSVSPNPRRSRKRIPKDYPRADPDEGSSSDIGDVLPPTKRRIESSDEEAEAPPRKGKKVREEVVYDPTMEEGNKSVEDESSTLEPKTKQRAKITLDKKPRPRASTTSKADATVPSVAEKTRRSSRRKTKPMAALQSGIPKNHTDNSFEDLDAEEENHPATTIKASASDAETARAVAPRESIKSSAVTKRSSKSSPKRKRIPSSSPESSDSVPDSGFELDPIESSATSSDDGSEEPLPKVAKVKTGSVKKGIVKNGGTKEVEKKNGAKENLDKDRSATVNTTGKKKKGGEKQEFSGSKMAKEFSAALKKNAGNTRARAR